MTGDEAKAFRRYVAAVLRRDVAALPDLRQGQRGGNVQTLQKALNLAAGRSLAQDAFFGPATAQAVRDVQRIFGLGVDGVVGPRTRAALGVALQKIEQTG
jgi:peptidoglycan hydrolase-like protein with peptidoglycan-binding domain